MDETLTRCLRCDTLTEWDYDADSGCPNCGYSEGMMEEDLDRRDDTNESNDPRDAEASVVVDIRGVAVWPDHGDTVGRVAVNIARPRFAYVRNTRQILSERDRTELDHAVYDIVDNQAGSERVLAYCVRYQPAVEIVTALNVCEDMRRG